MCRSVKEVKKIHLKNTVTLNFIYSGNLKIIYITWHLMLLMLSLRCGGNERLLNHVN